MGKAHQLMDHYFYRHEAEENTIDSLTVQPEGSSLLRNAARGENLKTGNKYEMKARLT